MVSGATCRQSQSSAIADICRTDISDSLSCSLVTDYKLCQEQSYSYYLLPSKGSLNFTWQVANPRERSNLYIAEKLRFYQSPDILLPLGMSTHNRCSRMKSTENLQNKSASNRADFVKSLSQLIVERTDPLPTRP